MAISKVKPQVSSLPAEKKVRQRRQTSKGQSGKDSKSVKSGDKSALSSASRPKRSKKGDETLPSIDRESEIPLEDEQGQGEVDNDKGFD